VDGDRGGVAQPGVLPDLAQQLAAAEHLTGVADQERQKVELAHSERYRTAGDAHLPGGRVDDHVPRPQRRGRLAVTRPGPAQDAAHTSHELAWAEWLDDVVVGAELETDDPVRLVALGGQHDDRGRTRGADLPADVQPVDAGQHEVEDDQVRGLGGQYGQRSRPVGGHLDAIALPLQIVLDDLADGRLVVDNQHPLPGHASSFPASTVAHRSWRRQTRPDPVTSS
jgi:hypothetical protein